MNIMRSSFAGCLVVFALLAGCVPVESTVQPTMVAAKTAAPKLPKELIEEAYAGAFASQISKNCRRSFRYDRARADAMSGRIDVVLREQGFDPKRPTTVAAIISQRDMQDRALAYIQKRNILIGNSASWCAAGQAELAEGTMIGKYLIKK